MEKEESPSSNIQDTAEEILIIFFAALGLFSLITLLATEGSRVFSKIPWFVIVLGIALGIYSTIRYFQETIKDTKNTDISKNIIYKQSLLLGIPLSVFDTFAVYLFFEWIF